MPQIILFPHTTIESGLLESLTGTFGSMTLCLPWFTEPMDFEKGALNVCFPPETLKPREDFRHLLNEYQGWMRENRGKNRPAVFSAGESGDETWAIRKAIREAGKDGDDPAPGNTLKWHLVLTLARNLEEDRDTARNLLQRAVKTKSPLAEAVERDEQIPDMFRDLPLSDVYPYVTDRHLNLIFEAWFGLFGEVIEDEAELLTLDPQVMNYAFGLFDGCDLQPIENNDLSPANKIETPGVTVTRKTLPRLLNPSVSTDSVLRALSGKTFILVEA